MSLGEEERRTVVALENEGAQKTGLAFGGVSPLVYLCSR